MRNGDHLDASSLVMRGVLRGISGLAVLGQLLAGSPAGAQTVGGRVLDESTLEPVSYAAVTLVDSAGGAVTTAVADSLGSFFLRATPGHYRLRAARIGFATATSEPIELRADEPIIVELRLSAQGVPLEPLIVRARGIERGEDAFARRRLLGEGVFLDPDSVALREPRFVWQALRGVEGMTVRETGDRVQLYSFSGGRCMVLYVDNNARPYLVSGPSFTRSSLFDRRRRNVPGLDPSLAMGGDPDALLQFVGDDVRGVEVYRDFWEIPEELRTASRIEDLWPDTRPVPCGMAIIWTKVAW